MLRATAIRGTVLLGSLCLAPAESSARRGGLAQVLWRDPGPVQQKDLAVGSGGVAYVPQPPFQFVDAERAGSSTKMRIRDTHGNVWSAKFGEEIHSDTFAARLAWAVGYVVEPSHYVRVGRISGPVKGRGLRNVVDAEGVFHDARLQLRSQRAKFSRRYNWSWGNNPFLGTRELNGLKMIVMLTSNWDNKDARDSYRDANTAVFEDNVRGGQRYLYFISDWGGSMGRWGNVFQRSKWDCRGYRSQNDRFVRGIRNGYVLWGYSGQHTKDVTRGIRVEDVRWLMRYLGRLSDRQLEDGLVASGATQEETACFVPAIRNRIERLRAIAR